MRNVRFVAFMTASAVALGGWTAGASAVLEDATVPEVRVREAGAIDRAVVEYIGYALQRVPSVSVSVSPGGDVSVPSVSGGVIAPPPPPPIVREALLKVAATLGVEGEVEITISRDGGSVSVPSVSGGVIAPPPPPPIVRELLERVGRMIAADRAGSYAAIELRSAAGETVSYSAASV